MAASSYSPAWYGRRMAAAQRSAARVLPPVLELVKPSTVLDLGCGTGTWLAEARRHGIVDVVGIDGPHVDTCMLEIPRHLFAAVDLAADSATTVLRPYADDYDLAISLEVAEHLPAARGPELVGWLCGRAPVVLFSAAVPHQPGNGHVNCHWQSYWAGLFEAQGYACIDCVRPAVWNDTEVSWWYRQNVLLYVSQKVLARRHDLDVARIRSSRRGWPLDLVHPQHHEYGR